jgi:hypothetical protein
VQSVLEGVALMLPRVTPESQAALLEAVASLADRSPSKVSCVRFMLPWFCNIWLIYCPHQVMQTHAGSVPVPSQALDVSPLLQSAARAACLRLQGRLLAAFTLRTHPVNDASWACVSEEVAAQWLQVVAAGDHCLDCRPARHSCGCLSCGWSRGQASE